MLSSIRRNEMRHTARGAPTRRRTGGLHRLDRAGHGLSPERALEHDPYITRVKSVDACLVGERRRLVVFGLIELEPQVVWTLDSVVAGGSEETDMHGGGGELRRRHRPEDPDESTQGIRAWSKLPLGMEASVQMTQRWSRRLPNSFSAFSLSRSGFPFDRLKVLRV